jgi:4-hydroxy-tetrahydrodipicolinate reductase
MIKLTVTGACGKMGQMIITNALASGDFELVGAVERENHPQLGMDIGLVLGSGKELGVLVTADYGKAVAKGDITIEFTNPETTLLHLKESAAQGKAMVIGTTGLNEEQLKELKTLAANIPCVFSPNMSLGVNLLFRLAAEAAQILGEGFDIEIVETHHRMKKDAPSGTAVKLADVVAEAVGRDMKEVGCYGRHGITGERDRKTIGVMALRGGDIVGDHTIMYLGTGEKLEISHRATSRETFAMGALRAAKYVVDKPKGLYDMQDVLGLKNK